YAVRRAACACRRAPATSLKGLEKVIQIVTHVGARDGRRAFDRLDELLRRSKRHVRQPAQLAQGDVRRRNKREEIGQRGRLLHLIDGVVRILEKIDERSRPAEPLYVIACLVEQLVGP